VISWFSRIAFKCNLYRYTEAACVALVASTASPEEAAVALDTLATILGNAMSAPRGATGDKFRSIRPGGAVQVENPADP
jgi:hypothetical protein